MSECALCKKKAPLYRCPVCGASGHVDVEAKTVTLHAPPLDPKILRKHLPVSVCFPSHFDCELAKPVTEINMKKLILVEA